MLISIVCDSNSKADSVESTRSHATLALSNAQAPYLQISGSRIRACGSLHSVCTAFPSVTYQSVDQRVILYLRLLLHLVSLLRYHHPSYLGGVERVTTPVPPVETLKQAQSS